MSENKQYTSRRTFRQFVKGLPPVPIILICLFEFLGLLALPAAVISEKSQAIGLWYQIYVMLTAILSIAIIYSLWKLKKIGIYIYIGAYILHNIVAIIAGNWMVGVLVIPCVGLILLSFSLKHFK